MRYVAVIVEEKFHKVLFIILVLRFVQKMFAFLKSYK